VTTVRPYAELVEEALSADFTGWDFSWLDGRAVSHEPSWSYADLARQALGAATRVLDVDTGGGELLASLAPLPEATIATEGYLPNLPIARDRLSPLGVDVRRHDRGDPLPLGDNEVDLILNRHARLDPAELARVLRPDGVLVTQQVGNRNDAEINDALGAAPVTGDHDCATAVAALRAHGFEIIEAVEEWPEFVLRDVGALIFQLRAVSWQIPDFDVTTYEPALRKLDERIRRSGSFVVHDHRFLIRAQRR
jgi:SAM-dependent methyltransferase